MVTSSEEVSSGKSLDKGDHLCLSFPSRDNWRHSHSENTLSKFSSLEPLGQYQPNLAQSIIKCCSKKGEPLVSDFGLIVPLFVLFASF